MASTATTLLSGETRMALQSSFVVLDALHGDIEDAQDTAAAYDSGARNVHTSVDNLFIALSELLGQQDLAGEMSTPLVEVLSLQVAPALTAVATELTKLWESIKSAIQDGDDGEPLLLEYARNVSSADGSAVQRLTNGVNQAQELVDQQDMSEVDQMLNELLAEYGIGATTVNGLSIWVVHP